MTVIYVDTSALLKRVLAEPESLGVADSLRTHAAKRDLLTSSSLAWIEIWRALRRATEVVPGLDVTSSASNAPAGIAELPLNDAILDSARTVGAGSLDTLDAIHLASALAADADVVMTFGVRLAAAATSEGLAVAAPA